MLKPSLLSLPFVVASICGLPACDVINSIVGCSEEDYETDPSCEDPTRAQVVGTVTVPEVSSAAVGEAQALSFEQGTARQMMAAAIAQQRGGPAVRAVDDRRRVPKAGPWKREVKKTVVERWRPSEIIVRAHEPIRGRKAEIAAAISHFLGERYSVDVQQCGTEHRCLATIVTRDGKALSLEHTALVAKRLAQMPFLKYAEKNLILDKAAFPSDEYFTFQWHYNAIDVPAAWDITTGDNDVVGAIIDTGVLYDHPDLAARVIQDGGADLITDPATANDGDGRDDSGNDDGDNSCGAGCHSHHGSHVAGTMGADTDNGEMVAGITWAGRLLAVRVLGDGGGSLSDIADGIVWAVGTDVDGVSINQHPADVLNMSLGGGGESAAMNEAIQIAVDAGAIVLVAAGNDNVDASEFTPANAPAAITVAAVGYNYGGRPERASYSNYGNDVEIAAPGGEQAEDSDGDGNGDGVLSTVGDFINFYQGTSMATPHVAGVAMLMKSVNRDLNQAEALQILQDTADTDIVCSEGCGTGEINAYAAVVAASGGEVSGLSAASVRVGRNVESAAIVFRNLGDTALDVDFTVGGSNRDAVTLSSTSERIAAKGRVTITATIERTGTDVGSASIRGTAGDTSSEARLDWTADAGPVVEEVFVMPLKFESDGSITPITDRLTTTTRLDGFAYKLYNLDPGTYMVIGVFDGNNDGDFDDTEDSIGFYQRRPGDGEGCTGNGCNKITLAAGDTLADAAFIVSPGFSGGDDVGGNGDGFVGDGCASNSDCGSGLYCESGFTGGYCTADCASSSSDCPSGSTCFDIGVDDPYQICFLDCAADGDCRDGYVCDFLDGVGSCISES